MNGHEQRRLFKMDRIIQSTIALCNKYGSQKVSVDEIAKDANVSKVTIYKYFQTKEMLIEKSIDAIYSKIIQDSEKIIYGEGDFHTKLITIMQKKIDALFLLKGDFIDGLFQPSDSDLFKKYNQSIQTLMFHFFDEGKEQGYIDASIPNETLFAYSEIFNLGLQQYATTQVHSLRDSSKMSELIDLYFYGLIRKDRL